MSTLVMAELDPAIHVTCDSGIGVNEDVDHRVKPGDDDRRRMPLASVAPARRRLRPVPAPPFALKGERFCGVGRHPACFSSVFAGGPVGSR
jgi:hypothetical protein